MIEPWTRWDVLVVEGDFSDTLREAQKHSFDLRQVRVVRSEKVYCECPYPHDRVVLLINPELMDIWRRAASGERAVKKLGVRQLYQHAREVLRKRRPPGQDDCIPF
jgi:hypothetical protein